MRSPKCSDEDEAVKDEKREENRKKLSVGQKHRSHSAHSAGTFGHALFAMLYWCCICYDPLSIHLTVCPSRAGILSKWLNISPCIVVA